MALRNLIIARHGESLSNIGEWDFKKNDALIPLTENGRGQSFKLGKNLAAEFCHPATETYIFCSPYLRAVSTAKGIHLGLSARGITKIYGATLIPDLAEREIKMYFGIKEELKALSNMGADERFFYASQHVESAMNAASRMQRAIFDIKSWSRTPKNTEIPMNIILVGHSFAIEAWEYLDSINQNNRDSKDKIFPEKMDGFGDKKRLKNCEYILKTYNS